MDIRAHQAPSQQDTRFGDELLRLRRDREISQVKLSAAVNIAQTAISKIERGEMFPPDIDKVEKIGQALNCSAQESGRLIGLALLERNKKARNRRTVRKKADFHFQYENFGNAFRSARESIGYSMRQFSNDTGISERSMISIERGKRMPTRPAMAKIMEQLRNYLDPQTMEGLVMEYARHRLTKPIFSYFKNDDYMKSVILRAQSRMH